MYPDWQNYTRIRASYMSNNETNEYELLIWEWIYIQSVINDFHICPEIKHYGCMVDLICKANLLEDALELIRSMKNEPKSIF